MVPNVFAPPREVYENPPVEPVKELLKEKARQIQDQTSGLICPRLENFLWNHPFDKHGEFGTDFHLVIPSQDNYSYILFKIRQKLSQDFPVAFCSDCTTYTVYRTIQELDGALTMFLHSQDVVTLIQGLVQMALNPDDA